MKVIRSIVRPDKVDAVKEALGRLSVCAITVAHVHDYAPQAHETTVWLGHVYSVGFSSKSEIAVVVHDDDVDDVVDVILRAARTGRTGDGFVSVAPVEHRYNICTGERDVS
jgi:nitrogen regulatory protein P-II 1